MSLTVCISGWSGASAPDSQGGLVWYYLDWALGFQDAGATVLWLEADRSLREGADRAANASRVRSRLAEFGLDCRVVLWNQNDDPRRRCEGHAEVSLAEAHETADLFVDLAYFYSETIVRPFRRSAFVDGDPGVIQSSLERGELRLPSYSSYFTLSETLPMGLARFPACGLDWHHARPPVHLPSWPVQPPPGEAPYTTITNWWARDKIDWFHYEGQWHENSKRAAWMPFLGAPGQAGVDFEAAVTLTSAEVEESERALLEKHGWRVRTLHEVPFGPREYQRHVQGSRGEFACAKPAYVLLHAGMIYQRSIHYLASGRPVVIQDTGPVSYMEEPPCRPVLRFRSPDEAVEHLRRADRHHEQFSLEARLAAEDLFSAEKVAQHILDVSLG